MHRLPLICSGVRLLAVSVVSVAFVLSGQSLNLRLIDGEIRLGAPAFHFVEGPVAERLRNGTPAAFSIALSVAAGSKTNVIKNVSERFVLSYDLWEEKFGAAIPQRKLGPVVHRSAVAAESWCFDQLTMGTGGLPANSSLWFRLEVRPEEPSDEADPNSAISLRGVIDAFSKTRPKPAKRWVAEAGPIQLKDLRADSGLAAAVRLVAVVP